MKVNAKTFSERTGFPLKLIRRMCRMGQLEHWRVGKVYWLDEQKALAQMELYKEAPPAYQPKPERKRRGHDQTVDPLPEQYSSRTEWLKAMFKKRKAAAAATATAKTGNKKTDDLNDSPIRIIAQQGGA